MWINVDFRAPIQFSLILSGIGYAVGTLGWVITILPGTVILYFKYKHGLGLFFQWKDLSLGEKRTQQKEKNLRSLDFVSPLPLYMSLMLIPYSMLASSHRKSAQSLLHHTWKWSKLGEGEDSVQGICL